MITVEYTRSGQTFCLQIYGHARSAPRGEDLVCCAASMLVYTAAESALNLYCEGALRQFPETKLDPGCAQVVVITTDDAYERVAQMFRTVASGYLLLSEQYPEYVMFRETVFDNDN